MQRDTVRLFFTLSCAGSLLLAPAAALAKSADSPTGKTLVALSTAKIADPASDDSAAIKEEKEPVIPKFSVDYMDKSVKPGHDFFHYSSGNWIKNNPVPADKSRWGSFAELAERNSYLLHAILEEARKDTTSADNLPRKQIGNFFNSAMNTKLLEEKKFGPIKDELAAVDGITDTKQLFKVLAEFHKTRRRLGLRYKRRS